MGAAGEAGVAASETAKALQARREGSTDAVTDSVRARFAGAPPTSRDAVLKILAAGLWRCRRYRDGAWTAEEGAFSYKAPWFSADEIREYDHPKRDDRSYLGYRVTPQGLAGMYGFLWLRVVDESTLIKEYSDTSGLPGEPSLVVPIQKVRWYTVCERNP